MLCWRFPRGGAQRQEPEPSSYLRGLVASWPSRRCSLASRSAPSSPETVQGARCARQRDDGAGGDGGRGDKGRILQEGIKAIGNMVRIWDGLWGGGGE